MGFEPLGTENTPIFSNEQPAAEPGRIWFDTSPDDGIDWYVADSTGWRQVAGTPETGANVDVSNTDVVVGRAFPPATFDVTIDNIPASTNVADPVNVDFTIHNTGGNGTQTIQLTVDGQNETSTSVEVDTRSKTSETLTWDPSGSDEGMYTVAIESDDDSESNDIFVEVLPANFELNRGGYTPRSPNVGDDVDFDFQIKNSGNKNDSQTIQLLVDNQEVDSTTVDLDPGSTKSKTLTWYTSSYDVGSNTVEIKSDNDSDSHTVTVDEDSGSGGSSWWWWW